LLGHFADRFFVVVDGLGPDAGVGVGVAVPRVVRCCVTGRYVIQVSILNIEVWLMDNFFDGWTGQARSGTTNPDLLYPIPTRLTT
jgi:hypothetical protein